MNNKFKKKEKINYKKERAILSDVLPYEVPAIFSNRYFYRFLVKNEIEIIDKEVKYDISIDSIQEILKLIFDVSIDSTSNKATFTKKERNIPFVFKIAHKKNDYRALSIMHPFNQVNVVSFYENFSESIKYFSNQSEFSIRKPFKVAKNRFLNDYLRQNKKKSDELPTKIELHNKDEEHLKSFFTYKEYSNIHGFFESYDFQRSEKKFNKLYKIDINKCFDSIYTHTIAWALLNKSIVKDNLNSTLDSTFAGQFDKLMQNMNYGETNGILIGAEVSRIFAEVILQKVDTNVQKELLFRLDRPIKHKTDYQIYRYVDDYFIFYDNDDVKDTILETFKHKLKEYNLHISETKSMEFTKPIITDLTIAKIKITELINENFNYSVVDNAEDENKRTWDLSLKSKDLITKFKIIVKETNIEYKDILNYTIAVIEKRFIKIQKKFEKEQYKVLYINKLTSYIIQMLDTVFFLYSVSPRVTSTIKVVSIISKLLEFIKNDVTNENGLHNYQKELIYKKVYDEIFQILTKNKFREFTQNETLYLLLTLNELGKNYRLDSKFLLDYFFSDNIKLNYFVITTLLYYIKKIKRYDDIYQKLLIEILNKFKRYNKDNLKKSTEHILLLLDLMTCPYIETDYKKELLVIYGITDVITQDEIIKFSINQQYWFIKWKDFKLADEIEMKKSQEVYS